MGAQYFYIEPQYIREDINDFSIEIKNNKKSYMLLGPLAFVNHHCNPNTVLLSKSKTYICIKTLSRIEAGTEITVSYGNHYFGPNNINCKCSWCLKKNETQKGINNNLLITIRQIFNKTYNFRSGQFRGVFVGP